MIDIPTLLLFLAAAWAVILLPGPDILYVLSRSLGNGRRAGIISALGIGFGECVQTLLAVAGLAAILQASITAFLLVKALGAVYLVYLGIKTIRDKQAIAFSRAVNSVEHRTVFWQGTLTNLLNPKAELFFVAFLPQFVNPLHGHAHLQILSLGLLFAVSDILFLSLLAHSAGYLHTWLGRHPKALTYMRWGSGGILIGLGVRLAITERP
jgi:threonine/homoserine/homoserine lactone efflux protein